jgi:tetratricopeptide (TPR) repeat protein
MTARLRYFHRRRLTREEGKAFAEKVLVAPIAERIENARALHLDDPELLLYILGELPKLCESDPTRALAEATFLHGYLEKLEVRFPADPILLDEREFFLGEAAWIAGAACRVLARRDDARRWFDRSESWFLATENGTANIARLAYQRLALRMEEREFDAVLELAPRLVANFERMEMREEALKARFLQAIVLQETGKLADAVPAFEQIARSARLAKNDRLLAHALVNLAQIHGRLSDVDGATSAAKEAAPLLREAGSHGTLAKLQWGVGYLLRSRGDLVGSIEAFRSAQEEFRQVGLYADVAAVHLILADLLLDAGQAAQAEWEIRAALPIIDAYKLVPEGVAALSLLRQSLQRRQIDRQALRSLHGYFREN